MGEKKKDWGKKEEKKGAFDPTGGVRLCNPRKKGGKGGKEKRAKPYARIHQ